MNVFPFPLWLYDTFVCRSILQCFVCACSMYRNGCTFFSLLFLCCTRLAERRQFTGLTHIHKYIGTHVRWECTHNLQHGQRFQGHTCLAHVELFYCCDTKGFFILRHQFARTRPILASTISLCLLSRGGRTIWTPMNSREWLRNVGWLTAALSECRVYMYV